MSFSDLREVPGLVEFPDHDLEVLAGIGRILSFVAGTVIIEQGERPRAAYILLRGDVDVVRRQTGGSRTRLGVLRPGALFGAVALLDGGARAASCLANGDVRVMEFSGDDFQRLTSAATPLGARFLMAVCRQLVRDLRSTNARMAELAGLSTLSPADIASTLGGSLI